MVHFHSDGSNNDWGYKITITATSDASAVGAVVANGFDVTRGKVDGFRFSESDKVAVSPNGPKLLYSGVTVSRSSGGVGMSAVLEWSLRDLDGNSAWGVGFVPGRAGLQGRNSFIISTRL